MNYLAHLLLSADRDEVLVGNVLGDLIKGSPASIAARFGPGIAAGAAHHQRIDRFTDGHEHCRVSIERLTRARRRLAGIVVDVFYDHFLARDWDRYGDSSLEDAVSHGYERLGAHVHRFAPRAQGLVHRMIGDDWLTSYRDRDGVAEALRRLSRRLSRGIDLTTAMTDLMEHEAVLRGDFAAFMPELIRHVCREYRPPRLVTYNEDAAMDCVT